MEIKNEHRLTEVEERSKSNTKRINDLEKRQNDLDDLVGSVKVLADREERVESDVKEIKIDVKNLTAKPGQMWEKLITTILGVVVGAIVGFLLTKIGL